MVYNRQYRWANLHKKGEMYMAEYVKNRFYTYSIYRINNKLSWDSILVWNYEDEPLLKVKFSSLEKGNVEFKAEKGTPVIDIIAMIG